MTKPDVHNTDSYTDNFEHSLKKYVSIINMNEAQLLSPDEKALYEACVALLRANPIAIADVIKTSGPTKNFRTKPISNNELDTPELGKISGPDELKCYKDCMAILSNQAKQPAIKSTPPKTP